MNQRLKNFVFFCLPFMLGSCAVSNNLYFNDAMPMNKGGVEYHGGLGMGMVPNIDSYGVGTDKIYFSERYTALPIIAVGAKVGVTPKSDLGVDLKFLGGWGIKFSFQHSLHEWDSKFNIAFGAAVAGTAVRDSLFHVKMDKAADYQMNADIYMPISYSINYNLKLTLTPRYTLGSFFVRNYVSDDHPQQYTYCAPVLTLGVKYRNVNFEASGIYYRNNIIPMAGLGFTDFHPPSRKRRKVAQQAK